jgi:hypothetical protein
MIGNVENEHSALTCKNRTLLSGSQLTKISVPFFRGTSPPFLKDNLVLSLSALGYSRILRKYKAKIMSGKERA